MESIGKVRAHPRISLNKLGEYLVARPARRARIIRDSKYPSAFKAAWYTEAIKAICDWVCAGANDETLLSEAVGRLIAEEPETDYRRSRKALCIDAIQRFNSLSLRMNLELPVGRAIYQRTGSKPAKMNVNGVSVSVRPDIVVVTGHGNNRKLGAIKLSLSKSYPLTEESGEYVATVLHTYLGNEHRGITIDASRVKVVDVFTGAVHSVPRARKQRMKDIFAACEEIGQRWASISQ